jgi:hypothetical protein
VSAGCRSPRSRTPNKLCPAQQGSTAKTTAPAAANQSTGQDQTRQAVFFAALLVFVVVHVFVVVIAACGPAGECEAGKTAAPAAANQPTGQDQTRQAVFLTTLLVFVVVHLFVVIIAGSETAGECETGKTAAAAAAREPTCQCKTPQAVFFATFLVFVVIFLVLSFKNLAGECDTGKTAAAHSSGQKNLSQMTLLSITVQAVTDFLILRHRFSFHHVSGKTRHVTDIARTRQLNGQVAD